MSAKISSPLKGQLANAYSILETTVYRTKQGTVFTIEIGESLLEESTGNFGAKVTSLDKFPVHLGTCEGNAIETVRESAQQIIAQAIQAGNNSIPHKKIA